MVNLIKKDGIVVGWEMRPTTDEEQLIAAQVRDLQFFGLGDTAIEGRKFSKLIVHNVK